MKKIANVLFKIHIRLFKYPCASHVRLALHRRCVHDFEWNVGMLYVCAVDIQFVADWFSIDIGQVKSLLLNLVKGINCE
jgi:hypothetical protein